MFEILMSHIPDADIVFYMKRLRKCAPVQIQGK